MAAEIVPLGVSEFPLPLRSTREAIDTPFAVVSCEASNQSVHPAKEVGKKTLKYGVFVNLDLCVGFEISVLFVMGISISVADYLP